MVIANNIALVSAAYVFLVDVVVGDDAAAVAPVHTQSLIVMVGAPLSPVSAEIVGLVVFDRRVGCCGAGS